MQNDIFKLIIKSSLTPVAILNFEVNKVFEGLQFEFKNDVFSKKFTKTDNLKINTECVTILKNKIENKNDFNLELLVLINNQAHLFTAYYYITFPNYLILVDEIESNKNRFIESKFKPLYEIMTEGVALHKIVFDNDNKAINYIILDVNPAYETHTGLKAKNLLNKLVTEAYNTETVPYLEIYSKVALNGQPETFEIFFDKL